MNDHLEDDLRRALGHASERAPHAPSSLSSHIVTSSRRRRTRAQALVAAVAVAVVAGGVGVTVRGVQGDPASPVVSPTQVPSAEITTPSPADEQAPEAPDPVEEVWPQAVRKIPAKLPDGRRFQPQGFIDDHTLLVQTQSSFEKADAIYAYDMDSAEVRKIADVPTPRKTVLFASDFTIGAGQVAWWTARKTGDGEIADLWAAPLSGGEARLVASHRNGKSGALDPPAITGDGRIAFSFRQGDGVFTVPLGGGAVEPVAGAEKYHIMSWPWVGSGGKYNHSEKANFGELLNVETGEKRTVSINPGEWGLRCGVTMCVGRKSGGKPFSRLRDGSQERDLQDYPMMGLAADRFLTVHLPRPGGQVLHDLATGKSGDLGIRPNAEGVSVSVQPGRKDGRLVDYPLKGELVIIDLTKIR
ncbi:hypothetical protein [Streptosporangium sp. NPDC000396]|uniref:hypothetical protein n=1 Tax=Streptosporangium sp. NPDC000396 TaxID=3366185 RepID=UPI0036A1F307